MGASALASTITAAIYLILFELCLAFSLLDGFVGLLVILLQEGIEAHGVFLKHLLALQQGLLLLNPQEVLSPRLTFAFTIRDVSPSWRPSPPAS
jgi:hypothetical protein